MDIYTFGLVVLVVIVFTLQIRKQRVSMHTLVWPYLMLLSMFILVYPPVLHSITRLLNFKNTENVIFFIFSGYLFVITVVHEIRIAKLNDKVNTLSRQIAIDSKEKNDNSNDD